MRWSVAAVATAALVVSGSGLVVFAQSGAGESQGPQFAPADSIAYVEARLDLPAGQEEAVAQMLTAFPGFADPGSFDMKRDELLAMLAAEMGAAAPEGDLIGDVFTGEVGIALGDLEAAMMGADPTVVIGMAMADEQAAEAMMDGLVEGMSATVTESSYNDVAVFTDTSSSPPASLAMHSGWMLIGTGEGTVAGAIDVLDGSAPGLADNEAFVTAWSRLPSARIGAAWMDLSSLTSFVGLAGMMAESETGMALPMEDLEGLLPKDMVASLVAESDRLTLDVMVTPGDDMPPEVLGVSLLSLAFPPDTQVYLETRELGASIETGLNSLAELLAEQEMVASDDPMDPMSAMGDIELLFGEDSPFTDMLGVPLPELMDFVGDAGFGAGLSSDGLWFGMAGELDDPVAGTERVSSLLTVLRLFTMQAEGEGGIAIETEMVGDVEVTNITLPLDEMLAEEGIPFSLGDTVSVAVTDDMLLLGLGDFVQSAILSDGTDSLGTSSGFLDALAGDTPNAGVMYVNVSSLLGVLDPMLSMMAPEWAEIAPYAAGIDRMIVVPNADDEVVSARMTVIVGQ
jgi:hypothetical protein